MWRWQELIGRYIVLRGYKAYIAPYKAKRVSGRICGYENKQYFVLAITGDIVLISLHKKLAPIVYNILKGRG